MPEEHVGQLGFDYAWKELLKQSRATRTFTTISSPSMAALMALSTPGALQVIRTRRPHVQACLEASCISDCSCIHDHRRRLYNRESDFGFPTMRNSCKHLPTPRSLRFHCTLSLLCHRFIGGFRPATDLVLPGRRRGRTEHYGFPALGQVWHKFASSARCCGNVHNIQWQWKSPEGRMGTRKCSPATGAA